MNGMDPEQVRWSDLIVRIRAILPNAKITAWCNEDTPLIWAQLIRELAGVDPLTPITGGFDLISEILSADGKKKFVGYLKTHPPQTETQKRRIIAAFLEKYALNEEIEDIVDMPGWTDEYVERLTALYDDDIEQIERMPGINFIAP